MKNNTLKQMGIKVAAVGMSVSMAAGPQITAYAEEATDTETVPATQVQVDVPQGEAVESDYSDAKDAIDEAVDAEAEAAKNAVLTIGAGIISEETQAILADSVAKVKVDVAEKIVEAGEGKVDSDLTGMDDLVEDAQEAKEVAETAADNATEAEQQAEDALADANNASTSAEANAAAEEAGKAAEEAAEEAKTAQSAEDAAKKAAEDAQAEYDAAVRDAAIAVGLANKALESGAEDAAKALEDAQAALDKAEAIKTATGIAVNVTEYIKNDAQSKYDKASLELEQAKIALAKATLNEGSAIVDTAKTGAALVAADAALAVAEKIENNAEKTLAEKKDDREKLVQAKADAEKALKEAKIALEEAESKEGEASAAVKTAESALKTAQEALDLLDGKIKAANDDIKAKEEALANANKALGELTDEDYEKNIYKAEQELAAAKTDEEIAAAQQNLISVIIKELIAKEDEEVEINEYGVYEVSDGEKTTFYRYEVAEDGTVNVYEQTKSETTEKVVNTFTSKTEFDSAVAGKTEGKDYVFEHQEAVEAEYTIQVNEKVGTETKTEQITGAQLKAMGEIPAGASFYAVSWLGIEYEYYWDGYGWKCDAFLTGYLRDDDDVYYSQVVDKYELRTYENVKESDVPEGANKLEQTKKAIAESWFVKYLEGENNAETVNSLDGLGEEGVDYVVVGHTDAIEAVEEQEATYTATYTSYVEKTVADGTEEKETVVYANGNPKNKYNDYINNSDVTKIKYREYVYDFFYGYYYIDYEVKMTRNGQLQYKYGRDWYNVPNNSYLVVTTEETKYKKVKEEVTDRKEITESDLNKDGEYIVNGKKYTLTEKTPHVDAVEGKDETYTIIKFSEKTTVSFEDADNTVDAVQKNISALIAAAEDVASGKENDLKDANKVLFDLTNGTKDEQGNVITKSYADTKQDVTTADGDLKAAEKNLEEAKDTLKKAQDAKDELQAKYNKEYVYKTERILIFPVTEYEKKMAQADAAILEAAAELKAAQEAVELAEKNQKRAAKAHEESVENLKTATIDLFKALIKTGNAATNKFFAGINLTAATNAYNAAVAADDYAQSLVNATTEARDKADEAKAALEALLQKGATVGEDKLEAAKKKVQDTETAYLAAKAASDKAQAAAKDANDFYQAALNKLADLIIAEQIIAAQQAEAGNIGGGAGDVVVVYDGVEGGYSFTIPVAAAGQTTTPATRGAVAARRTAVAAAQPAANQDAGAGEVVEIEDGQSPLAVEETQAEDTVEIQDEEVAKGVEEDAAKRFWWWIIVAIIAATGVGTYEYNRRKSPAGANNKSVKTDKADKKNNTRW